MSTKRQLNRAETQMVWILLTSAVIGTSLPLGAFIYQTLTGRQITTWNPVNLLITLLSGHQNVTWTITIPIVLTLFAETFGLWYYWTQLGPGRRTKRQRGDDVAKVTGQDIANLTETTVAQKAERLGVQTTGLPVGLTVKGARPLYSSWEDVTTLIAGMRTGKTTSWVIPRILETPGAVVVTSNKRDVVDATIGPRTTRGRTAWIFDPQNVVGNKPQTCWWNPLTFITDSTSAIKLANVIVDATRDLDATTNAFFDNSARDLVAALFLAASLGNRPITETYKWVNDDTNTEPQSILRRHDEPLWEARLNALSSLVAETRSGVYGGASTMLQFLSNSTNNKWITPQSGLAEFQPTKFVQGTDTLYALSLEGGGSAAPILAALTVAVAEAALEYGAKSPNGRLPTPMLIELDEAANICPWRELPNQYSHFGSRGIVVDTILQSWSQGAEVWGEAGMKKLWGPANLSIYLGGSKEIDFLKALTDLIGNTWTDTTNLTISQGGSRSTSTNYQSQSRQIATIADLAALPLGRAWVFASGTTPVLIETQPWMNGPHSTDITNSIRANNQR